jgi:muramoyltetrapeptide carboxypeptidase
MRCAGMRLSNAPMIPRLTRWFARGGYGSNRIAQDAVARLNHAADAKAYLGYSDMGYLLAALYRGRIGRVAHGPMVADGRRTGGDAALTRALTWLTGM